MSARLDDAALKALFYDARTHNGWQKRDVGDQQLVELVDLMKWAPTSVNCSPARIVFVKSAEAKAKLKPFLMAGNVDKTMAAPATAILATDYDFAEHLPMLFPHTDAKAWFAGNEAFTKSTACRNATLQGGYFILAARALGLDCGPMSGFDNAGVDAAFFSGTKVQSNFLCNLGYGDPSALHPRSPRFAFAQIATIV